MTLVSPGVETSIIDESLFVSNSSSLVPLFFIATQDEKLRPDGNRAEGTYEHSRIRSVTSLRESINLYGEPKFNSDSSGNQFHGDARNEYGLFAMNQYLGIGNNAYAVRANVNLNDDFDDIEDQWEVKTKEAATILNNLVNNYINSINTANGLAQTGLSVLNDLNVLKAFGANQTSAEYSNVGPYGDFTGGQDYVVNDVITLRNSDTLITTSDQVRVTGVDVNGTVTSFVTTSVDPSRSYNDTVEHVSATNLNGNASIGTGFELVFGVANVTDFKQTSSDFDGTSPNGSFEAGSDYAVGEVLTMSNGATVVITSITGAGATGPIDTFALTDVGTFVADAVALTTSSGSTAGTGFTLTPSSANLVELKTTVSVEELTTLSRDAVVYIFDSVLGAYSYRNMEDDFFVDKTSNPLQVFAAGFTVASTGTFPGFDGLALNPPTASATADTFTPQEAENLFNVAANDFMATQIFLTKSSLGANDTARRVSIVSALQAAIAGNTDVRSETFQFNIIACPGYPEVVDELLALSADVKSEALVVADTPNNLNPDGITNPTNGWALSSARQNNTSVCYYYPWCYGTNLDGSNVLSAPSGAAIRQMAYNDNTSFLWFAPAGVNRGLVSGVSDVGYASGVLGSATTFTSVALNQGQRDALYQDVPSGRLNPIVFLPGKGITIMGQKTSAPTTSALDRINVVRLVMHVRRQLRLSTFGFIFEPNDQKTRDNVKALADNFLGTILTNRGIIEYLTVCDDSNNTPDVVDRSELILDVLIKPTKAVEFISIPIRIVSQGAEI